MLTQLSFIYYQLTAGPSMSILRRYTVRSLNRINEQYGVHSSRVSASSALDVLDPMETTKLPIRSELRDASSLNSQVLSCPGSPVVHFFLTVIYCIYSFH